MLNPIRFTLPIAVFLLAARVHAQVAAPVVTAPKQDAKSYRLLIVASDAVAFGLFMVGDAFEREDRAAPDVMMASGAGVFFLGGPVVHLAHGEVGRSALSLGARLVLPIIGGYIGAHLADCSRDAFLCGLDEMATGMVIGAVGASVVDVAFIARSSSNTEPSVAREQAPAQARARPGLSLAPRVVATQSLTMLGVVGSF